MDDTPWYRPAALDGILADAAAQGFAMSCEDRTGSLLGTLAASQPGGQIVELGTGVGAGAAWLLHGMDSTARLTTVEMDPHSQAVAVRHLGEDPRVTFHNMNADRWLDGYDGPLLDLVYVDCRPGKFRRMGDLLTLMRPGGIYLVDDLMPQATWPADHQPRVDKFLEQLPGIPNFTSTALRWASGLVIGVRI
ncbi:class I SAM-dependent methyltransferase [Streptomyces sp. NPDC006512]|uniref:O-methyltransferase n=1 Tax=Streptomyces sp. NPDC006512 TaxID=3154307 RepID=UPI0033B558E6